MELYCQVCGKPVVLRKGLKRKASWEHSRLQDTPVPWHNPQPEFPAETA